MRRAVKALTRLAGVKLKMASAILDGDVPEALHGLRLPGFSRSGCQRQQGLRFYVAYLAACREMAARYGVSLRDFDRANWQWSKDQSKTKKKKCVSVGCENEREPEIRLSA